MVYFNRKFPVSALNCWHAAARDETWVVRWQASQRCDAAKRVLLLACELTGTDNMSARLQLPRAAGVLHNVQCLFALQLPSASLSPGSLAKPAAIQKAVSSKSDKVIQSERMDLAAISCKGL